MLVRNRRGRVFDDSVNLSSNKEYFLDEVILTVQSQPRVDELSWQWLNKLRDIKLCELFLLHHGVCFGSLGWLSELIGITSLISHPPKLVSSLHGSVCCAIFVFVVALVILFELLLAASFDDGFDETETL